MKIFIQIFNQGGKGIEEAAENRNYLAGEKIEFIFFLHIRYGGLQAKES